MLLSYKNLYTLFVIIYYNNCNEQFAMVNKKAIMKAMKQNDEFINKL